jgi:hypothetical protein
MLLAMHVFQEVSVFLEFVSQLILVGQSVGSGLFTSSFSAAGVR